MFYNLLNELKKLSNLVLDSGYYRRTGIMKSYILFINRVDDPFNYRGITLTSFLGKLFSTLLHVRIENEGEKKNYSPSPKQASGKIIEQQTI